MKNAIRVFLALLFLAAFGTACSRNNAAEVLTPSEIDPATPVIWVDGSSIPLSDLRAEVGRLGRNLRRTSPKNTGRKSRCASSSRPPRR